MENASPRVQGKSSGVSWTILRSDQIGPDTGATMHDRHGYDRHGYDRHGSRARLGLCLPDWGHDAFWVQVFDAVYKRGQTLPVELIPLDLGTLGQAATP